MLQVQYIGEKPRKTDNVGGTSAVWHGHGDVQPVPPDAWNKLKAFPTIWCLFVPPVAPTLATLVEAPAPAPAPAAPAPAPAAPKPAQYTLLLTVDGKEQSIVLDDMTLEALKAFNAEHQLGVDNRTRDVAKYRELVFAAATADPES